MDEHTKQVVLRSLAPETKNAKKVMIDQIFLQHIIFNDREQVTGSQGLGVEGVLQKATIQNFLLRWLRYIKQLAIGFLYELIELKKEQRNKIDSKIKRIANESNDAKKKASKLEKRD